MRARRVSELDKLLNSLDPQFVRVTVDLRSGDYARAAQLLREAGFNQGVAEADDGTMCAGGAVVNAVSERLRAEGTVDGVVSIEGATIARDMDLDPRHYGMVQQWNDEAGRTVDEVVERLEYAAQKLRDAGR